MVYCPECGQSNVPNAKFCRHCGASLAEASQPVPEPVDIPTPPQGPPVCRSCGTIGTPDEKFCGNCGSTLRDVAPVVPEIPVPPPPSTRPCSACGAVMGMEMKFCGECGASMTVRSAPAPVSPIFPPHVPQPAPYAMPVQPVSGRSCRSCGNLIKPGEKFCSKCCAIVKDEAVPVAVPVAIPPPTPVSVPLPAAESVCPGCGNPIADTEKFCGFCGTPVVRAPPPAPATQPKERFCGSCGALVRETTKFCNVCGTVVGASPAPGSQSQSPPVSPLYNPAVYAVPPSATGAEEVIGVIGNAKKMKMFGVSYDTYTLVITNRRMIFAQLTQALANTAIMEAQVKAKAEGKGFLGIVQDQMAASFGFALRYEKMSPDQALVETPGNIAIENSRISAIKMQLKESGNQNYHEFKTVIESMDGKFEYMIAEDERFTNLLKTVYGDRLHMPLGYFSKAGVRIKFF